MKKFTIACFFLFFLMSANAQDYYPLHQSQATTIKSDYPFLLGFGTAFSFIPYNYDGLSTGISLNSSAFCMMSDHLGMGAEYSFLHTSTKDNIPNQTYTPPFLLVGTEKYRQFINYVGPSLLLQESLDDEKKWIIRETLSAGVTYYRLEYQSSMPIFTETEYTEHNTNFLLSGNSISGKIGLSGEYLFKESLSIGIGVDLFMCQLKKVHYESTGTNSSDNYSGDNDHLEEQINLSRLDFSIIFRYYYSGKTKN